MIPELKDVEIKESWYWDLDNMHDDVLELQRKIRLAKKERKLQPPLLMQEFSGAAYKVTRYRILDLKKGYVVAESSTPHHD